MINNYNKKESINIIDIDRSIIINDIDSLIIMINICADKETNQIFKRSNKKASRNSTFLNKLLKL